MGRWGYVFFHLRFPKPVTEPAEIIELTPNATVVILVAIIIVAVICCFVFVAHRLAVIK